MQVELTYLLDSVQKKQVCEIAEGTTIQDVLNQVKVSLPEDAAVGIFGELKTLDHYVEDGWRLEIYTPLVDDPKDKRFIKVNQK